MDLKIKNTDRLLKLAEVAERLSISRTAAYRLAASGELRSVRFGKSTVRVLPADLDDFIVKHRANGGGDRG